MDVYENLRARQLTLPEPPPKGGLYRPVKQVGNLLFTSGIGPLVNGEALYHGKVGGTVTVEQGQEAARTAALNILSVLHAYLGDLNRVKSVVKLLALVASADGFGGQPQVVNAASQTLIDAFGEAGQHARSAIGVNELPGDIPIEIEAVFEIEA